MKRLLPLLALLGCAPAQQSTALPPPAPSAAASPVDPEAWRSALPKSGSASAFAIPRAEIATLSNGMTVSVLRKSAGTVSLALVLNRGAARVGPERAGLAPLTARLLTEGTRQKTAMEVAVHVEDLGSSFATDATRLGSHVALEVLLPDLAEAVELIAECVRTPAFRAPEFERVRSELVDRALGAEQDPDQHAAMLALRYALGPELGSPVQGTTQTLRSLTLRDVKRYYEAEWAPAHAALTLVGDVSLDDAVKLAEKGFGSWKHRPAAAAPSVPLATSPTPAPAAPAGGVSIYFLDRPGSVQTAIVGAKAMGVRDDAVHVEREIVNKLFGGLFTSRLNANLREEHAYTYGASSLYEANPAFGRFLLLTSVETPNTAAAVTELLGEVDALATGKEPLQASELDRATSDLVQRLAGKLEHVTTLAPLLEAQFVEQLPGDYFATYPARAKGVTLPLASTQTAAFGRQGLVLVLVGDARAVGPELTRRGLPFVATKAISEP